MKISIVITAYNVESTIERAINSALNQTHEDKEIIVVNDASTDNTLDILKSYGDKIIIVDNETNIGAGLSRRYGIARAIGEYVNLLDGDDFLDENYISDLVKAAIESDADMVSGGITYIKNGEESVFSRGLGEYTGIDKFKNELKGDTLAFLNNKIVRRKLYDIVDYCGRRFIEDSPTLIKLLYYANKIVYVPTWGYYYVVHEGSLVTSATKEKSTLYGFLYLKDCISFFEDKEEEYKELFPWDGLKAQFLCMRLNGIKPKDFLPWKEEWNEFVNWFKEKNG